MKNLEVAFCDIKFMVLNEAQLNGVRRDSQRLQSRQVGSASSTVLVMPVALLVGLLNGSSRPC